MTKIEKALEQIKNKKQAPDALEYLTMLKSEMSGREMSPDDFNTYDKLGKMEHSLYRYNSFLKAGLPEDAEKEGEKFFSMSQSPDGTLVLKGGISNCRYVWQTEKGACDACQALDGKEFETLDDVPERPHPNCKCDIVPIEEKKEDERFKLLELINLETTGEYYGGAYNINSLSYPTHNNEVISFGDMLENNLKQFIASRYDINEDTPVVVPAKNSKLYEKVIKSEELQKLVFDNLDDITNGNLQNGNVSSKYSGFNDLALTLGKFNVYNLHIDFQGNIRGTLVDYYDFSKMKSGNPLIKVINNRAYKKQELGILENYVIIMPIEIRLRDIINYGQKNN